MSSFNVSQVSAGRIETACSHWYCCFWLADIRLEESAKFEDTMMMPELCLFD